MNDSAGEADSINDDGGDDDGDGDDGDYGPVVATADVVLASQGHKGGSLTSDFSPISPTSQVLIDSINRKRGGGGGGERGEKALTLELSE